MKNGKGNFIRDLIEVLLVVAVWGVLFYGFLMLVKTCAMETARRVKSEELKEDEPEDGVGRLEAKRYLKEKEYTEQTAHKVDVYTAWEGSAPAWFRPEEEMAIEWTDVTDMIVGNKSDSGYSAEDAHAPEGIDPGGIDYNICSTLWGWDGHSCEAWEMDLFSRIFYREFWQPNLMLCEAGCDAMLGLWDLNGGTMYETLSAVDEDGRYAFSTYPAVWTTEYDADGLAWCKAYCEERFTRGPEWTAQYFRKGCYHDWGQWSPIPAYEIDGIYFSTAKR